MATMSIRATYAFDVATARRIEDLARRWGVSKSEALRRAVQQAAEAPPAAPATALDALQRVASLERRQATDWANRVSRERRQSMTGRRSDGQ